MSDPTPSDVQMEGNSETLIDNQTPAENREELNGNPQKTS